MRKIFTEDIFNEFKRLYNNGDFRILKDGSKTVEIQNANFICDKNYILREPNFDYASREVSWYDSQSLYVKDIEGKTPAIWEQVSDINGKINSNYGWCIYSEENGLQYKNCLYNLLDDKCTRQAVMIYNRPSMHNDSTKNHMRDFMCTFAVQCFLNHIINDEYNLRYIVYQRSCDAVFGFNNDCYWHTVVYNRLCNDLNSNGLKITKLPIEYNCGSIHVYERHFKYLV